jgi:hypothetical protein
LLPTNARVPSRARGSREIRPSLPDTLGFYRRAAVYARADSIDGSLLGIFVYAPALRRQEAEARADISSPAYAAAARRQTLLGALLTLLAVVIVILMVTKPG